jgi:hypothetical protein
MDSTTHTRSWALATTAAILVLLWILSFWDPCLIAALRGGPLDSANPIAVARCMTTDVALVITNGDLIVRSGALCVLMGLFGVVGGLLDPTRRKRSFLALTVLGASGGVAAYSLLQLVLPFDVIFGTYQLGTWLLSVIVSSLATVLGAAAAESTVSR